MRFLAIAGLVLGLSCAPGLVSAQPKVSIEARVEAVLNEIASWVRDGWQTWQAAKRERVRASVPTLVADFLRMAAVMDSFAGHLQDYAARGSLRLAPEGGGRRRGSADDDEVLVTNLRTDLRLMQDLMRRIVTTTQEDLDVDWTTENVSLADRSFQVVRTRAGLVREADSLVLAIGSEEREVDPAAAEDLARRLRGIAAATRRLAEAISVTTL